MKAKENKTVRTTIDLPANLHEQILAEAGKEKRVRHAQIIDALGKFCESPDENAVKEQSK